MNAAVSPRDFAPERHGERRFRIRPGPLPAAPPDVYRAILAQLEARDVARLAAREEIKALVRKARIPLRMIGNARDYRDELEAQALVEFYDRPGGTAKQAIGRAEKRLRKLHREIALHQSDIVYNDRRGPDDGNRRTSSRSSEDDPPTVTGQRGGRLCPGLTWPEAGPIHFPSWEYTMGKGRHRAPAWPRPPLPVTRG